MPPYHENASRSQERLMFAKAGRGEVSEADALGRARATKADWSELPQHVRVRDRVHAIVAKKRDRSWP